LNPQAKNFSHLPRFNVDVQRQGKSRRPVFSSISFPQRLSKVKLADFVLLTVHPCIICFIWSQLGAQYFLVYLFQFLYMFRATMCPSSGELTVSMRHWYFSLYMGGCDTGIFRSVWVVVATCMGGCRHPYRTKIPVLRRYSKFFWWWARGCPKHV